MKTVKTNKMGIKIKRVLTRMVFMLMVCTVFAMAVPTNISAATITVPDDYPTIQQAINGAIAGDTVYVRAGTYYEHVTIGKSLSLEGEDRNTTIIDAGGSGNAIYLTGGNVNIEGITATNSRYGIYFKDSYNPAGVVVVSDCMLTSNERGIQGRYNGSKHHH